ncbi:ATP-grasp domain-containing protein [Mucilaginibacter sp. JRF]|uniref:ATP-grasp domain-containing protein n=1 Tax=Mucilaginibacter sp. JRF TaxID=2780088 RepID=UPI00187E2B4A|nr:ATP-grasp domain-containing protein [Mucilaginibacter sp. JRF]MBE9583958.1 ATP-grasp domain-containing protein [Mucilaginibacter sp. JRF]
MQQKVAVIYQTQTPPARNGIIKPMKPGGYADSGADIAYSLRKQNIDVISPADEPGTEADLDWVFPDTAEGIQAAINKGADTIWLNTVLYDGHPIEKFIDAGIAVVGQIPKQVDIFDDKLVTNELLKNNHLPIPRSVLITHNNADTFKLNFGYPVVAKPIRGRGSQGVYLVNTPTELTDILADMFSSGDYGDALYAEEFLPGTEVTITVMPPGGYVIDGEVLEKDQHWSLPPVRRFNHANGIAPYNGTVAVIHNSEVLNDSELQTEAMIQLCQQCELAAKLVQSRAPIRIDCRANAQGENFLFDLNMKPNMTGASRPHRTDQDSLTALAARKIGWSFDDLISNMLKQSWRKDAQKIK